MEKAGACFGAEPEIGSYLSELVGHRVASGDTVWFPKPALTVASPIFLFLPLRAPRPAVFLFWPMKPSKQVIPWGPEGAVVLVQLSLYFPCSHFSLL